MKRPILTLRISRRAIGAAVLAGNELTLRDGRHMTSDRDRAALAATRYIERLLDLAKPGGVVMDAPEATNARPNRLLSAIESLLRERHISLLVISRADVLNAYGVRRLKTRRMIRDVAKQFWPELDTLKGRVQPYVTDAAAAALYAESRIVLHATPA